ncbi:high mobility group B protein 9-like [Oryza brachyantha]|uniref:high mobility group B protein 9-like n=1 Tax=Oryza brachyantha TaxID=4533 RepID=UPI001ADBE3B5|nr:high mobility group B protein 9-like [Oryza brachyantha]
MEEVMEDGAGNAAAAAAMAEKLVYPPALLSHEEVAMDRAAFMDTLRRFHSFMGTKFMIPVIGGKELDLHALYVEVTSRGGLAKVMEERKWREVMARFRFSPTTTSASYVLRRYYLSLLHHYEQVYFFRAHGALLPPAASALTKTPRRMVRGRSSDQPAAAAVAPETGKRAALPERLGGEPCSFSVTGSIDGKFEHGYFVTVKIAGETLRGVLYRVVEPPPPPPPPPASAPPATAPLFSALPPPPPSNGGAPSRSRRRRGRRQRDPAQPKPSRSGYNLFFKEKHPELKAIHPHRERDYSKMIGDAWNHLAADDKMVYYRCSAKDKERYKMEMQEYNDRLKLAPSTMAGSAE